MNTCTEAGGYSVSNKQWQTGRQPEENQSKSAAALGTQRKISALRHCDRRNYQQYTGDKRFIKLPNGPTEFLTASAT